MAMAVIALLYGLISGHGIWYPINLLGGMLLPGAQTATVEQLEKFSLVGLVLGIPIHGIMSVGVGLLYGLLLPTLPKNPVVLGGLVMPLLWTGGIYGFMDVLNPPMRHYVDWWWFILSQVAYGLTVGYVVYRTEKINVTRPKHGPGDFGDRLAPPAGNPASEGHP